MENIKIQLKPQAEKVTFPDELGFGKVFTDHFFEMDYEPGKGWHNPVIKPFSNLNLNPGSTFIHYGQAIFEGLKAYKTANDEIVLFRPEKNFERLNRSARRLVMPEIDIDFGLKVLKELVLIDKEWIPTKHGESLYIRPFMFGSDPFLGIKPSSNYKLVIILSPVGAYYPEGFKPVKILAQDEYVRAVKGGLGDAKTPANYAASLLAGKKAKENGYAQVLWLDAIEKRYIEEVGAMNIFIRFKDEVVTPELTGSILPGITRASTIEILRDWGEKVVERQVSIYEVLDEYEKGNVLEIFGTGTAAVISSVGCLSFKDKDMCFNEEEPGELAKKLFDELTGFQYGKIDDRFNWITRLQKKEVAA